MTPYNTIAEMQHFIVLDSYTKYSELHEPPVGYQTEAALEHELIEDLRHRLSRARTRPKSPGSSLRRRAT